MRTTPVNIFLSWGFGFVALLFPLLVVAADDGRPDILFADFEADSYGNWKVDGEAFGDRPAKGTLPGQMHVSGFQGKGLVNSFRNGDGTVGTLTSPEFKIERPWINFLVGGGGYRGETCINLKIDGKVVRSQTGPNDNSGGSEELAPMSWDVSDFLHKKAVIEIVDQRRGGWGHINVDHILFSDHDYQPKLVTLEKTLLANEDYLLVPVSNSAPQITLEIRNDREIIQDFTVRLPRGDESYWMAPYPLEQFDVQGKQLHIASPGNKQLLDAYSESFELIRIGKQQAAVASTDYDQPYRNQFHVSTRRGWVNDPNGMMFHNGKYHLYYQYNPFGVHWGNMHWGHFVSTDLIHWQEKPIALHQKTTRDMMFSGGGFVDFNNSAGLGKNIPFVAFTSTGRGECLAYSLDGGMTYQEIPENPVVRHQGRDPKIIWYEPEKKWVMAVYSLDPCPETEQIPPVEENHLKHNHVAFYESKDLRHWTKTGAFTHPDRMSVHECPELFELPVEGKPGESRWVYYGASNRFFIGQFDGKTFHAEQEPQNPGRGAFWAAQTFSDTPDGRRIQIGWARPQLQLGKHPDQITNQCMTLPHELTLHRTQEGLRVFCWPIEETKQLRDKIITNQVDISIDRANELIQAAANELTEIEIEFAEPGHQNMWINGIDCSFNSQSARIFNDRTIAELYIDNGYHYEVRARGGNQLDNHTTHLESGSAVKSLKIYRLNSIWEYGRQ